MRAQDRLGGHLVSGHVDGIGTVAHFAPVGESWELRIATPPELARFIAYKGSITVNGVSLTVNRVIDGVTDKHGGCELSINLIPHTLQSTTLGGLKAGMRVNLEIDLIARYVERMLSAQDRLRALPAGAMRVPPRATSAPGPRRPRQPPPTIRRWQFPPFPSSSPSWPRAA